MKAQPFAERLLRHARIDPATDCWIWTGWLTSAGYGRLNADGRAIGAHRWVFENLRQPIPEGLEIDHLCRNRACVNPEHLEVVERQVNIDRAVAARSAKRTCKKGHPRSVYGKPLPDGRGYWCEECQRQRRAERGPGHTAVKCEHCERWITAYVMWKHLQACAPAEAAS